MSGSIRVRTVIITVTVANGQATANGNITFPDGIIRALSVNVPVTLTSATYTVTITGPATGFTLFSKAGISGAAGATNVVSDGSAGNLPTTGVPASADTGISISTSGNEGAQRVFTITALVGR